jgi:hypothetical protein
MVRSVEDAARLVRDICKSVGIGDFVASNKRRARRSGLVRAVRERDTRFLYSWLMDNFSFQGISDRIATDYIETHGNATWDVVESLLQDSQCDCPKLGGFESYKACGFRKTAYSCNNPPDLASCPVPLLPLRKGDLNQMAFSLYFFLRDRRHGDLVGFIDDLLKTVTAPSPIALVDAQRSLLVAEFSGIHAISAKLINMTLADLLMFGGSRRPAWVRVGQSMIAIDSLVHNFFHRTGILAAYDRPHLYGPRCYGDEGCATILQDLAHRIDARAFDPTFPAGFPRAIQFAIWSFCAEVQANICNGRRIDDRYRCALADCPVFERCARIALRPVVDGETTQEPS